jgi:hypothetical protein
MAAGKTLATSNVEPFNNLKPANPRRGLKDHVHAVAFIKAFPIGTIISGLQLDNWLEAEGMLTVPRNVEKRSVEWRAHLFDRHECRNRLNRGASHPRMHDDNLPAFAIDSVGQGTFEVRAAHAAAILSEVPHKVERLLNTKYQRLVYLMQSIDYTAMTDADQIRIETLMDQVGDFRNRIMFDVERLDRQYAKLDQRIQKRLENGTLKLTRAEAPPSAQPQE